MEQNQQTKDKRCQLNKVLVTKSCNKLNPLIQVIQIPIICCHVLEKATMMILSKEAMDLTCPHDKPNIRMLVSRRQGVYSPQQLVIAVTKEKISIAKALKLPQEPKQQNQITVFHMVHHKRPVQTPFHTTHSQYTLTPCKSQTIETKL